MQMSLSFWILERTKERYFWMVHEHYNYSQIRKAFPQIHKIILNGVCWDIWAKSDLSQTLEIAIVVAYAVLHTTLSHIYSAGRTSGSRFILCSLDAGSFYGEGSM